jgi:hypothetical protein
VIFGAIRILGDHHWAWAWWGAAIAVGLLGGFVLGFLYSAERDDGERQAEVERATGGTRGQASAPLQGAEEVDQPGAASRR